MRVYTKEWHELSDYLASVDLFEPIEDGDYSDADIEKLHQKALENYLKEERELYDEREPFNEKEETELFEEMYKDSLDEPDEDIPAWIREAVDPRLIALGLLPEGIYKRLEEEMEAKQKRFEELDEIADRVLEEYEDEEASEEYEDFEEKLSDMQSGYILSAGKVDSSYEIEIVDWDFDEDEDEEDDETEQAQVRRIFTFSNADVIEDEGLDIEPETDEDGDVMSNCELMDYELYNDNGRYEVHMLLDNGDHGLKYLTLSCDGLVIGYGRSLQEA